MEMKQTTNGKEKTMSNQPTAEYKMKFDPKNDAEPYVIFEKKRRLGKEEKWLEVDRFDAVIWAEDALEELRELA